METGRDHGFPSRRGPSGNRRALRIACGLVLLGGVAAAIYLLFRGVDWPGAFAGVLGWVEGRGREAALWLFALQALQVILAIPGPFFTLAAGLLLGTMTGSVVAVSGSTAGAVVAYGIARYARARRHGKAASEPPPGRWASDPRLSAMARFVMGGGWRIVLSSRLIPLFPFKLSNYFFGWVRYPFAAFFWGTFLGIAPLTIVSVSTGALAADVAALARGETGGNRRMLTLAVFAAAALLLAWSGWRARLELRARHPATGKEAGA